MAGIETAEGQSIELLDTDRLYGAAESQTELLRRILDAVRGPGDEEILRLTVDAGTATNRLSSHVRHRNVQMVISSDTAANITLSLGSATFRFRAIAGIVAVPFWKVIERGIDISAALSASATADIYLIGYAE